MFRRIFGLMVAALMVFSLVPTAAFARTAGTREGEGIVWDLETDPMMQDLEDYGFFALDGDGDGLGWEWTDDNEFSHYEGNGYFYSLSSYEGTPLTPNNVLFIPAFTGSSLNFYANQAVEGCTDELVVYLTVDPKGEDFNKMLTLQLDSTEPTLYTIETDPEAPFCSFLFLHTNTEGQGGVVIDYITMPDGVPYIAEPQPIVPEIPEGMTPIDGAEAFGLYEPQRGALCTVDVTIPDGVPYSLQDAYWQEYDPEEGSSSSLQPDDTFSGEEGKEYFLTIELIPDEGYWFDLSGAITIDGEESNVEDYSLYVDDGLLEIQSIHFTIAPEDLEPITAVDIIGFEAPVVGESEESNTEKLSVPENANYEIISAKWYDEEFESVDPEKGFEEGRKYELYVKIRPLAGWEFADQVAFTINGGTDLINEESSFVIHGQLANIESIGMEPTAEEEPEPEPVPVPPTGMVSLAAVGISAITAGACTLLFAKRKDEDQALGE